MAQNYMAAPEWADGKYEIVAVLPSTVIYLLASPSTQEPACDEVIAHGADAECPWASPSFSLKVWYGGSIKQIVFVIGLLNARFVALWKQTVPACSNLASPLKILLPSWIACGDLGVK